MDATKMNYKMQFYQNTEDAQAVEDEDRKKHT
jgi:hypothetical protein